MQAYVVARRFYRDVGVPAGSKLTFQAHVAERGYQCTAAFTCDEGAPPCSPTHTFALLHLL